MTTFLENTKILNKKFFDRDTVEVAKDLLGTFLVREVDGKRLVAKIVEVEAYLGEKDPAAHSFIGKTKRNKAMFGEAGHTYIYRIHQQHCFNVVTKPAGIPHGVLIRAAKPLAGLSFMQKQREKSKKEVAKRDLMSGPGKICQAMSIDMSLYGIDLTSPDSPLQVHAVETREFEIEATRRIGITKAADRKLRFIIKGSEFVSK